MGKRRGISQLCLLHMSSSCPFLTVSLDMAIVVTKENIWAYLGHHVPGVSSCRCFGHFEHRCPSRRHQWDPTMMCTEEGTTTFGLSSTSNRCCFRDLYCCNAVCVALWCAKLWEGGSAIVPLQIDEHRRGFMSRHDGWLGHILWNAGFLFIALCDDPFVASY